MGDIEELVRKGLEGSTAEVLGPGDGEKYEEIIQRWSQHCVKRAVSYLSILYFFSLPLSFDVFLVLGFRLGRGLLVLDFPVLHPPGILINRLDLGFVGLVVRTVGKMERGRQLHRLSVLTRRKKKKHD